MYVVTSQLLGYTVRDKILWVKLGVEMAKNEFNRKTNQIIDRSIHMIYVLLLVRRLSTRLFYFFQLGKDCVQLFQNIIHKNS